MPRICLGAILFPIHPHVVSINWLCVCLIISCHIPINHLIPFTHELRGYAILPFTSFARMWNHHKSHGSFGFARNQSRYFLGIHHCHCPNCSWMLIPTKTRQRTVKNPRSPNLPMVKPGISLTFLGFFLHLKSTLISLCFPPDLQNSPLKAASNPQPGSNRPLKADSFPNPVGPFRAGSSRWLLPQRTKNHGVWPWRRQVQGDHHAGFMMNDGKIW